VVFGALKMVSRSFQPPKLDSLLGTLDDQLLQVKFGDDPQDRLLRFMIFSAVEFNDDAHLLSTRLQQAPAFDINSAYDPSNFLQGYLFKSDQSSMQGIDYNEPYSHHPLYHVATANSPECARVLVAHPYVNLDHAVGKHDSRTILRTILDEKYFQFVTLL
jgi:hypothetical protein